MRKRLALPSFGLFTLTVMLAAAPVAVVAETDSTLVQLRLEATTGGYLAWADNRVAGPIEVRLSSLATPPPASEPALPARASVAAGDSSLLAFLPTAAGRSGRLSLRLTATPGSSNARPQDVLYLRPLAQADAPVEQGFEGAFSHQDLENRYALDFAVPTGTPVLAARGGTVMQVQVGFTGSGLDYAQEASRANFIRILHDDGSMALYAHLAEHGALVHPGQRVDTGQRIGLSGNTGYSTAPHLHFAVQVNRGGQLTAIPFRLAAR
ncbi:MAG: M23 family metallopeptidase [Xanthomonadaceae bacterium]|nr:M23 family metallopeptidase [Xanthomonadaceae bacterium]